MEKEKMPGANPEDKETINKEGWEGNVAVIVGSREELDRLREGLETGGICKDAATYVRMNKKIIVPDSEISEDIKTQPGKGWIGSSRFIYIDKTGNIAEIDIDYKKISSIDDDISWEKKVAQFVEELEAVGFKIKRGGFGAEQDKLLEKVNIAISAYKEKIEAEAKTRNKAEFDF